MKKSYFKKTLEYLAGNVFNKLIYIILLPLFTRLMAPEVYAVYSNLVIFISFLSLLYFLGIQQAVFSYFYKEKTNTYKFKLISSIYLTLIVIGIIFSLLIIVFRTDLALLIVRDKSYGVLFIYTALILFLDSIHGITQSLLNILERSSSYVLLGLIKHFSFLFLVIIFSITRVLSLEHIFIAMTITSAISALVALIFASGFLREFAKDLSSLDYFSIPLIKPVLKFGLIMIPGTMAMMILRLSDRYMLTYLSARELYDVGIYAIGYRVGMIMSILTSLVSMVYFPYAMRISDREESIESYQQMYKYFAVFGCFLGIIVILLAPEIFHLFIDSAYYEGIKIVFFGVISHFLLGLFNILNINFYIREKAKNIAVAVIIGALVNILLNFLLIPHYGLYGAGAASIFSYLLIVVINYFSVRIKYNLEYTLSYIIFPLLILLLFSLGNFILPYLLNITILKITWIFLMCLSFIIVIIKNKKFRLDLTNYLHGKTN